MRLGSGCRSVGWLPGRRCTGTIGHGLTSLPRALLFLVSLILLPLAVLAGVLPIYQGLVMGAAGALVAIGLDRIDPDSTNRPAYDHATMETSVPGVYVAGTACGGSQQRARVFIENSHLHVDRICKAITGKGVPWSIDPEMQKLTAKHEER